MRLVHAAASLLLLIAVAACGGDDARSLSADGPVVLVVSEAGSPGGPVPREEGLYASYGVELDNARAFTRVDLVGLPWRQITTDFPAGGETRTFDGPRLADVLDAADFEGDAVRIVSLDGYEAQIPVDFIETHGAILAIRVDGAPLATGALGPLMVVWPRRENGPLSEMGDELWPWGVFAIAPAE